MDSVKFWLRHRRPTTSLVAFLCLSASPAWSQAEPGATDSDADAAAAGTAAELLDAFAANVQDLTATFEQERFDESGTPVEEPSMGQFMLLRPDRFLWHYAAPFEEIIVADGEWLWHYDVSIEQAERRPQSELATTPVMLLSGAGTLRASYDLVELPPADGLRWLELTPIDPAAEFVSARIGFRDAVPVVVELVDTLTETTRISFDDIEVNTGLDAAEFTFVPPDGVTIEGVDD
jgi:outer membrane lipoprotein carrier protein